MQKAAIRHHLLNSSVINETLIGMGCSNPILAKLESGIKAVVKDDCIDKEVGAYILDCVLGFNLVPVTIFREYNSPIRSKEKYGSNTSYSFQHFINNAKNYYAIKSEVGHKKHIQTQLHKMYIFDYLLGNDDRHENNFLVDDNEKVWAIDNGYAFELGNSNFCSDDSYGEITISFNDIVSNMILNPDLIKCVSRLNTYKASFLQRVKGYFDQTNNDELYVRVNKLLDRCAETS